MGDATPVLRRSMLEAYQRCFGCMLEHPESAFVGLDGSPTVTCATCLAKARARPRAPQQRSTDTVRAQNLWHKYRITVEEYDARREAQSYRCAICGKHEDELPVTRTGRPRKDGQPPAAAARLVVDHCHDTGRVRGLLCGGCNSAIGHFGDSVEAMHRAIRYIMLNSTCPTQTDLMAVTDTP